MRRLANSVDIFSDKLFYDLIRFKKRVSSRGHTPRITNVRGFAWKDTKAQSFNYILSFYGHVTFWPVLCALHIHYKCLKPLEKHWRIQGINIAIFLDHGWLTEMSFDDCKKLSETVRHDIKDAGLITSEA